MNVKTPAFALRVVPCGNGNNLVVSTVTNILHRMAHSTRSQGPWRLTASTLATQPLPPRCSGGQRYQHVLKHSISFHKQGFSQEPYS